MTDPEFGKYQISEAQRCCAKCADMAIHFYGSVNSYGHRAFLAGAKWSREQSHDEIGDLKSWHDKSTFEFLQLTLKERDELKAEVERLKEIANSERAKSLKYRELLAKFKVLGTDGCNSCETGRITVFYANDKCIQCDPESYRTDTSIEHGAGRDE